MIINNRSKAINDTDGLPLPKRYWAILATALGVGMSVIDGTTKARSKFFVLR